jgi:hypothetical protein
MTPTRARTVARAIKAALALEAESDPIRVGDLEERLDAHLPSDVGDDLVSSVRKKRAMEAARNRAMRRAVKRASAFGLRVERVTPVLLSPSRMGTDETRFPYVIARRGAARAWRAIRTDAGTFTTAASIIFRATPDAGQAARALARAVSTAQGIPLHDGVDAIRRHLPPGVRVSHPPGATGQAEALVFLASAATRALSDGSFFVCLDDALLLTGARNARALRYDVEAVVGACSADGDDLPAFELDACDEGVAAGRPFRLVCTGFTEEESTAIVPGLARLLVAGGPGGRFARAIARLAPVGSVPPELGGMEEEDEEW